MLITLWTASTSSDCVAVSDQLSVAVKFGNIADFTDDNNSGNFADTSNGRIYFSIWSEISAADSITCSSIKEIRVCER